MQRFCQYLSLMTYFAGSDSASVSFILNNLFCRLGTEVLGLAFSDLGVLEE